MVMAKKLNSGNFVGVEYKNKNTAKTTKNVIKLNKNRTLLWYSITYHYDVISLPSSDANEKNSCIRR